ncbi:hypothetical protein CDD83_3544 [Cordyceps sp. RAO-2017]|nr:hypothetical protein CDD83_3544 [Cordyceps sp. RAO-2017]
MENFVRWTVPDRALKAEKNPESEVIGTDLSNIQGPPKISNVSFLQHDAEENEWPFREKFDYVHLRCVVTCFNSTQSVMQKAFDHMHSGAWIELWDMTSEWLSPDDTVDGTALAEWAALLVKGGKTVKRDLCKPRHYGIWLRECGFVDVVERTMPVPNNGWSRDPKMKEAGRRYKFLLIKLLDTLNRFLVLAGLSEDEIEDLRARTRRDILDEKIHAYKNL